MDTEKVNDCINTLLFNKGELKSQEAKDIIDVLHEYVKSNENKKMSPRQLHDHIDHHHHYHMRRTGTYMGNLEYILRGRNINDAWIIDAEEKLCKTELEKYKYEVKLSTMLATDDDYYHIVRLIEWERVKVSQCKLELQLIKYRKKEIELEKKKRSWF